MPIILAIVAGILFAAGIYSVLRRSIVKLVIGLVLISQAVNIALFTAGGLTKAASGAGSIVMFCTCVMVRPQSSVKVQVMVWEPPHSSKLPAKVPGTSPAISQAAVSPLV